MDFLRHRQSQSKDISNNFAKWVNKRRGQTPPAPWDNSYGDSKGYFQQYSNYGAAETNCSTSPQQSTQIGTCPNGPFNLLQDWPPTDCWGKVFPGEQAGILVFPPIYPFCLSCCAYRLDFLILQYSGSKCMIVSLFRIFHPADRWTIYHNTDNRATQKDWEK